MITNLNPKSNNCQASLNANTDQMRINAWEQLGQLIDGLLEFVKPKSNVHKEIKTKMTKIANAFFKVKALETGKEVKQHPSQLPERQFLPLETRARNIEELSAIDTGADADSESAVDIRPRPVKRKDRTPPETGTKKRREEVQTTLPSPTKSKGEEHSDTETETGWQRVNAKKRNQNQSMEQKNNRLLQKMIRNVGRHRTNVLIVRPKDKEKYADILCRVKKEVPDELVCSTVDKIRRTATGDLLIVINKNNAEGGQGLRKAISEILKDEATVICKGPQEDLEIRDLDDVTTKEDILTALQKVAGDDSKITIDDIKSLRKAYRGTQVASITLAAPIAKTIMGEHGRIKIGWVNCRIVSAKKPNKCFKCWHYGHLAIQCKSPIDRSKLCIRCGKDGHKIAECKNEARCILCIEINHADNCAHAAGTARCQVYKNAVLSIKGKKPKYEDSTAKSQSLRGGT